MKQLRIDTTDIFLDDHEKGQGKITVSDSYRGAFAYYWGAMGSDLSEFIQRINSDYFASNLCKKKFSFDAKGSVRNVRRAIKDVIPWYQYKDAQKKMRELIKDLEGCANEHEFVGMIHGIPSYLEHSTGLSNIDENHFLKLIGPVFKDEPWRLIEEGYSREYKWLEQLHGKLAKELKKETAKV